MGKESASWEKTGSGGTILSVEKALDTVELLADSPHGVTAKGISVQLSLPLGTVYRLLSTLCTRDYAYQDPYSKRYCLTPKLLTLSEHLSSRSRLSERSYPHLRDLFTKCERTVHLAVRDGFDIVYIHSLFGRETPSSSMLVGGRRKPAHATALGKALLSAVDEEEVKALAAQSGFVRFTPRTIGDIESLLQDLRRVRERGYAIDEEEAQRGQACFASVVRDEYCRDVAAVSINLRALPSDRRDYEEYGRLVRETCRRISKDLGYSVASEDASLPPAPCTALDEGSPSAVARNGDRQRGLVRRASRGPRSPVRDGIAEAQGGHTGFRDKGNPNRSAPTTRAEGLSMAEPEERPAT